MVIVQSAIAKVPEYLSDEEAACVPLTALSLPAFLQPFALIPVGYPAESRVQQNRFDETRIHWVK